MLRPEASQPSDSFFYKCIKDAESLECARPYARTRYEHCDCPRVVPSAHLRKVEPQANARYALLSCHVDGNCHAIYSGEGAVTEEPVYEFAVCCTSCPVDARRMGPLTETHNILTGTRVSALACSQASMFKHQLTNHRHGVLVKLVRRSAVGVNRPEQDGESIGGSLAVL
jgi:hypothetical protein